MAGSTYIEIEGKFKFSINQYGLDYNKKEERQHAITDFWREWEAFCEKVREVGFISFDYDEEDLKVKEGE